MQYIDTITTFLNEDEFKDALNADPCLIYIGQVIRIDGITYIVGPNYSLIKTDHTYKLKDLSVGTKFTYGKEVMYSNIFMKVHLTEIDIPEGLVPATCIEIHNGDKSELGKVVYLSELMLVDIY